MSGADVTMRSDDRPTFGVVAHKVNYLLLLFEFCIFTTHAFTESTVSLENACLVVLLAMRHTVLLSDITHRRRRCRIRRLLDTTPAR